MSIDAAVRELGQEPSLGIYSDLETLPELADYTNAQRIPILVREKRLGRLAPTTGSVPFILDPSAWRIGEATVEVSVDTNSADTLFPTSLDEWTDNTVRVTHAEAVLTPSLFVGGAKWAELASLVSALKSMSDPRAIPLLPVGADMLDKQLFPTFLAAVDTLRDRTCAFIFAGHTQNELSKGVRLANLRRLLAIHHRPWLVGVDPLVGTDAMCHGAQVAFVGMRSGLRWPAPPDTAKSGGFYSKGFLPGTFNRHLLEMRSPSIYSDWYAGSRPPSCAICSRPVDRYIASDPDKSAIIRHNLHSIHAWTRDLLAVDQTRRAGWLNQVRIEAFFAHANLTGAAMTVDADKALRRLVELDDPRGRRATATGHLV